MATISADAAALDALAIAVATDRLDAVALDSLTIAVATDRMDVVGLDVLVIAILPDTGNGSPLQGEDQLHRSYLQGQAVTRPRGPIFN